MDSKKYGRWGTGEGGCRIDLLVIQLYHWYDTSTVACSHLECALRSAPGTTPGATRAAVVRADGSLHRGRGGARPPHRPAGAAARRRALGVPLVHRARPSSVAPGVSPGRRARGAATLRREPALLRARARRAGVHRSGVALHRPGGWISRRRARGAAEPFLRARGRRPHPGCGRRALLQSRDRCPRRRRAPRDARRPGRPASGRLRHAEPLVSGRQRPVLESPGGRWLLLIHQLPPKPDYFRVKVWRRLQRIGAVAIKNSDPLQAPPDLDPEIVGLGRELMDEEQPAPPRTLEDWTLPPTHQRFRMAEPAARRTPRSPGVARRASAPRAPVAGLKKCSSATARVRAATSCSEKWLRSAPSTASGNPPARSV